MPRGKKKQVQEGKFLSVKEYTKNDELVKGEMGTINIPHGTCANCGHQESMHTHGPKRACTHACPCLEFK